ncbi:aminoglycoside phosphotransferase [Streptomyces sp. NPDC001667]
MPTERISWRQLPGVVRAAIPRELHGALAVTDVTGGWNCGVAALHTLADGRRVFVKGMRDDQEQAQLDGLDVEERINPLLPGCTPRVLWRVRAGGWDLLGFEGLEARWADYSPASPDLDLVVSALTQSGGCHAPSGRLSSAWERWGSYCRRQDQVHLTGRHLLHTDLAWTNVLIGGGRAHLVDWSWAARGPAWVDAALWGVRLILDGGHTPGEARRWASKIPAFRRASPAAVSVLAKAEARRWEGLAADGISEVDAVAKAARAWEMQVSDLTIRRRNP